MSDFNNHFSMKHRVFQNSNSNTDKKKEAADPPRLKRLSPSLASDEDTPVYTSTATTENIPNEIKGTILDTYIQKSWTTPPPAYTPTVATSSRYERRLASRANNMRFQSTARPVLTPFGERLLVLSERKLYNLESPLGGRDEATLLRGVLVREAVKSAWKSVETGQQVEVNNWQSNTAMGLDVIGEEDEEEDEGASELHDHQHHDSVVEQRNERWFEELVESFGEDDGIEAHEWIESEVGAPVDYDDFGYEEFEHYTLPSPPPPSPLQVPMSPSSPSSTLSSIESPISSTVELDVEFEAESSAAVDVEVVQVPDHDDEDLYADDISSAPLRKDSIPSTPLLSAACSPSSSPIPVISLSDDELECDDFFLPPPLHRCSSSSSLCTSDEDGGCVTPSSSCEDLELSVGSLLGNDTDDPGPGRPAFDHSALAKKVERWQTWDGPPLPLHSGVLGLDLDISLGMIDTI